MRNIVLVTSYDGTDFAGFQRQKTARTVQAELENAWRLLTGEMVCVSGAGRTDAGVHALRQVVTFFSECGIPLDRIPESLNLRLPRDIAVVRSREADAGFHARFSASGRRYCYLIRQDTKRNVFLDRYSLRVSDRLDLDRMREAAEQLVGSHDFRSFGQATGSSGTIRNVRRVKVAQRDRWIVIGITANAFLRGMARRMVGELMRAGLGHIEPSVFVENREACDPGVIGRPAPPNGLYLASVQYATADETGNGI